MNDLSATRDWAAELTDKLLDDTPELRQTTYREIMAQALRDERLRAVAKCREQEGIFASPEYATDQPLSSFGERFACEQCAKAIEANE